jgi:hypothetical protein
MKEDKREKGISMVVVLWIVTILTVVVAATALMTYSDITSAVNLRKRYRTLRAAEAPGDFIISYLPEYKKLHELDTLFNKVFYENQNLDTVFSYPLYLSRDSLTIGYLALPSFMDYSKDSSIIASTPTVTGGTDTTWANPVFTQDGAVIYYRTRGLMKQRNSIVAYRRIENTSAFTVPAGGGGIGLGHTMY